MIFDKNDDENDNRGSYLLLLLHVWIFTRGFQDKWLQSWGPLGYGSYEALAVSTIYNARPESCKVDKIDHIGCKV